MPVYRAEVTCTVALKSGGTATEKFITILELNTPLRDLAKLFTERFNRFYGDRHGLCLLEEVLDFTEGYMEMVGTVRECLRPDVELFVRGRQLSQKEIEQAAFSWFFSSHAISTPLITQELTQTMSTTLARALVPALIPSLIPALVPALAPALAPELIQNIAALRGPSSPPSQPHSHRLIASSSHNKIITPQDIESGSKTATTNKDPRYISEESSNSSESDDEDMDQDNSSESKDEGSGAVVVEMKIQEESSSDEFSSDEGDKGNDDHEHTKNVPAQMIKKATPVQIVKKDAAQIKEDNDNALVDMFKDDVYMDSDEDSSSDEDMAKPLVVPQVAFQASVAKVEPQVKESKDTTTISKSPVPIQFAPSLALPDSPNPVHFKTTTSSPAKVVESKPIASSGLDSLLTAQFSTSSSSVSSSSASSSPASSPSSSPTPVRSPAPSPAPAPRRESASIFAAPAVIARASTPLSEKAPLTDTISSFSPYRAFTAIATAPATPPIMSRTTSSSSLSSSSSSSSFLKRPSPDQSRRIVSPERPKKKQAGFAISVPLDPFRALSPEDRSDEDSEDDVRYSQEVLYSALSRPRRTPSPVKEDEEEMPVYIPLNLVVKQQQEDEDEDEDEEEGQSDHEQVSSEVISMKVDDQQEDEPLKSEAPSQEPTSITSSSEQSSSSQLTLVDIKQEHVSQNPSTVQAQYREAESEANNATAAASVHLELSTTRVFSDREDEEEDQRLSPVVSPPGALLEYLKSANSPASPKEQQQPDLSTAPKHPLSESDSSALAPVQALVPALSAPVPTTPSKKSLAETMAAYPTFASLASFRRPDIPDTTSNTDEIVAFLDKDMEGLSRDSSLTGPPFFLPVRPPGLLANHINNVTPTRDADTPLPFDNESTVSPELRPSVSPMVVPNIENRNKEDIKMDDLDLDRIPETQLHSDNEDSTFNIPLSQRPALPGTEIAAAAARAKAPNGWVDDTRDAMDDFQFSDDEERRATLKRRALEADVEELSESEYEQQPTDIPEGMFGQNRVKQPGQPEYRYETVFKDIHLTPTPSVESVQAKRPRLSSPSSDSGSDSDSDGSDAESSIVSSDEDEDENKAANAKKPHPLDALGELPLMISSQSSFSIMPTLTALSQERTTMTKKMGSLEMALKQQRDDDDDDNDEDDDDFAITIKRTGPPPVVRSRGRGGAIRGGGITRGASSPGRGGRGGRGGVTIAAARTGGRHPDSDSDSDIDSGRGRSSLQNLFS